MLEMHLNVGKKSSRMGYFIEELSNAQFTTYANISSLAGVTQGTLHNEGEGWLRFDYEGTELIVSKKTIRHTISWDHINSKGCVFGSKIITILGNQYKVRLLKGADNDPIEYNTFGNYVGGSHNSEWSRLFYPLVSDDATLNDRYTGPKYPTYTNLDLGMVGGNGSYSWCQERHPYKSGCRVIRGGSSVSYLFRDISSYAGSAYGWRPCLERL